MSKKGKAGRFYKLTPKGERALQILKEAVEKELHEPEETDWRTER